MLLSNLLAIYLYAFPVARSAPVATHVTIDDFFYQCGHVRTRWNSSAIAGLSALGTCTPFFWNKTIHDYQDAFAYKIYGGCKCQFYSYVNCGTKETGDCVANVQSRDEEDCEAEIDVPAYTEPTPRWNDPFFADPKPKWYNCSRIG